MSTVLVTGGMGFIGLYVARGLAARGDRVVVLDPDVRVSVMQQTGGSWGGAHVEGADQEAWLSPFARRLLGNARRNIVFLYGDATLPAELIDVMRRYEVDRIVHAASLFDPMIQFESPYSAFALNVGSAVAAFEAARVLKAGRVVFLSSVAAYGVRQTEPIHESHPTHSISAGNPSGPHGAVKGAAEALGMSYFSSYGVDFLALRISAAFGAGMRLPAHIRPMVESAVRQVVCDFEQGEMHREYIYIDDVVAAVIAALDADASDLKQRIFNISSGEIVSTHELAAAVRRVVPGADIRIGGGMSELEASNARMRGRLDVSAAREQLGFATEHDLDSGVAAYAQALRDLRREGLF